MDRSCWKTPRTIKLLIGQTRWSGKSNAATTVFERFDDAAPSRFVNLLSCLSMTEDSDTFDAQTKHEQIFYFEVVQRLKPY